MWQMEDKNFKWVVEIIQEVQIYYIADDVIMNSNADSHTLWVQTQLAVSVNVMIRLLKLFVKGYNLIAIFYFACLMHCVAGRFYVNFAI